MKDYMFTLLYQLDEGDSDHDALVERFGEAGHTDFMLGTGRSGFIGVDVDRRGSSAMSVLDAALADAADVMPSARLVEVSPDFAGLTDIAEQLGMSRQNMRKVMLGGSGFPLPVHGGSASIWHAAEVFAWLRDSAGYDVDDALIAAAAAAWQVNARLEQARQARAAHA